MKNQVIKTGKDGQAENCEKERGKASKNKKKSTQQTVELEVLVEMALSDGVLTKEEKKLLLSFVDLHGLDKSEFEKYLKDRIRVLKPNEKKSLLAALFSNSMRDGVISTFFTPKMRDKAVSTLLNLKDSVVASVKEGKQKEEEFEAKVEILKARLEDIFNKTSGIESARKRRKSLLTGVEGSSIRGDEPAVSEKEADVLNECLEEIRAFPKDCQKKLKCSKIIKRINKCLETTIFTVDKKDMVMSGTKSAAKSAGKVTEGIGNILIALANNPQIQEAVFTKGVDAWENRKQNKK